MASVSTQPPAVTALVAVDRAAIALYPPAAFLGPRRLTDFEIVLVVAGGATLTLDEDRHTLAPGSCVLARPGMEDAYEWHEGRTSRHYYVHFSLDPAGDTDDWPVVRHWPNAVAIAPLFRQLVWLGADGRGQDGALAKGCLWVLLTMLLTGNTEGATPLPATSEPLAQVVAYVHRRWATDGLVSINRSELAAAASVSVAHLSRIFRREYGVGPIAGMEWVRLARARALLERSPMTLSRIADACGFADQYHFSHRFTAVFGMPPSQARKTVPGTPSPPPAMTMLERALLSGD